MKNKKHTPRLIAVIVAAAIVCSLLSACQKPAEPQSGLSISISDEERFAKNSQALKNAAIGDLVRWGSYEQDNNLENGYEEIEWQVLDIQDGKAFLISKKALDCKQYYPKYTNATWETSTVREFLNGEFWDKAFTEQEKACIPTTNVEPGNNPWFRDTDPGPVTQDKVYILSITEVYNYFETDEERQCEPTDYAVANGAIKNVVTGNCWWWLRCPGYYQYTAAGVFDTVNLRGYDVNGTTDAVRPVIWIDLSQL